MAALGVGLAATAIPTMLAYAVTSKDSKAEDVGLFVGPTIGVVAGPAVGLWSGGRGDLAKKGLIARTVGGAAIGAGALGVAIGASGGSEAATVILVSVGVVGGVMMTASLFHDLAITPSATARGKPMRVGLGIRSDGLLAMGVQF